MARRPEIGNVQLYPDRPLTERDKNGYVLKFYCPIRAARVRKNCGTRDRRKANRILRECRERLLNGRYLESGGAITIAAEQAEIRGRVQRTLAELPPDATSVDAGLELQDGDRNASWQRCFDHYYRHFKKRSRPKSLTDAASRIEIAGRILDARRELQGLAPDGAIREYATLSELEYLQDQLLDGAEGIYDTRAGMTVNTMLGAVTTFLRYCRRHRWIEDVPPLHSLSVEEAMKGRPITPVEFQAMLEAVQGVVGERAAASWRFVLEILWESAFRVGDVMDFSWDDERHIVPRWPGPARPFPTVAVPSSQKNKKVQEIPMLPGLQTLLERIPADQRRGWVVNPLPLDPQPRSRSDWFQPLAADLQSLARSHNNSSIARACGVSETAVRKWLRENGVTRDPRSARKSGDVPTEVIAAIRARAEAIFAQPSPSTDRRLTKEYVGRVIESIGEAAAIVVRQPDEAAGHRIKYASAHDLRRGCAERLINAGVSAETLKVVMRHKDFKTTERFYGARRAAQSAAAEIHKLLARGKGSADPAADPPAQLNAAELRKLKALLNAL